MAIKRFPYFSVRLCSDGLSLFFEHNENEVVVFNKEQIGIDFGSDTINNHYLFFTVINDWGIFDISHILTDGIGAKRFLKAVLFLYCKEKYDSTLVCPDSILLSSQLSEEELENPLETIGLNHDINFDAGNISEPLQITNIINADFKPTLFRLKLNENKVINLVKNEGGTPNVLFSLLLNKAIHSVLPDVTGIRSLICVDSRKYLNSPYAHQNLISSAVLPYFPSFEEMPLKKQLSMLKGLLNFETIKENQTEKISQNLYRQKLISQELTLSDKYNLYSNLPVNNKELATNTVSYIKSEGWDCLEKYIADCSIISTLFTDISIELSVLNGFFYVDFYQKFSDPVFYNVFLKQLEKLNLHYVQLAVEEITNCRNLIPDYLENSNTEQQVEKGKEVKISEYKLFEPLVDAFEKCDFKLLEQKLVSYKGKLEIMENYILDNQVLFLLSKKLSNSANLIPFFVILFFLSSINSVNSNLENLECPEILRNFFSRLLAIKEKLKISTNGEFCIVSAKEGVLCLKRNFDSEVLYIVVNISDSEEVINFSDQAYWTDLFSLEIYKSIDNFKCNAHEFYLLYHAEKY